MTTPWYKQSKDEIVAELFAKFSCHVPTDDLTDEGRRTIMSVLEVIANGEVAIRSDVLRVADELGIDFRSAP